LPAWANHAAAVGGAAEAAIIERKSQLVQQARDFVALRHVAQARTGAEGRLVKIVQRSQAARKEFAVNQAFGQAIDRAEALDQTAAFSRGGYLSARPAGADET
jgi:hypothetical protein